MKTIKGIVLAVALALVAILALDAKALSTDSTPARVGLYHWQHGTPVGFTLSDLQHYVLTPGSIQSIDAKLYEAKSLGANTIRLQIVQDRLVGIHGNKYDAEYMSYIQLVTDYGLSLGLTMVLNAQTEYAKHFGANEPMPTHATHVFWQRIIHVYGNVRHVSFDLFNEPRHCEADEWQRSFQSLVWMVRKHASNPIWLEGCRYASTMAGTHELKGKRLVYTYHHPGAPWPSQSDHTSNVWDEAFGNLAWSKKPVVNAEYTNDLATYHMSHREVNEYLRYAKTHHIGMLVYGLDQKRLLKRYLAA